MPNIRYLSDLEKIQKAIALVDRNIHLEIFIMRIEKI